MKILWKMSKEAIRYRMLYILAITAIGTAEGKISTEVVKQ